MPRTSRFIEALRAQGWREASFWSPGNFGREYWDVCEAPRGAARCARIASTLQGASARTLRLIGVTLPRSMSRVERGVLRRSQFSRFSVDLPWRYRAPGTPAIAALVHLDSAMEAPADLEPDRWWTPPERAGRKLLATTRILDLHIQRTPGDQMPTLLRLLGREIAEQVYANAINPIDDALQTLRDDDDPYLPASQIEVRLQGDSSNPFTAAVMRACGEAYDEQRTSPCAAEYIDMEEAQSPTWLDVDEPFMAAIEECATGRIPRAVRPRARDVVNGTHHLLLRTDPLLRACDDGSVVNRLWLAEKVGWDRDDLAEIPDEPGLAPLQWTFLVDDATGVFCAKAWRPGTLHIDDLAQWATDVWAHGCGLLRGKPARLAFPAGYCEQETRARLAGALEPLGVVLTTPTSGGTAPISLLKLWCEQSSDIGVVLDLHDPRPSRSPMDWKFVQAWTDAQMLAEHTYAWLGRGSGSPDEPSRFDYAITEPFGRMRQIKVAEYAAAAGVNDLERFFDQWLAHATAPGTGFVAPKRIPRRRAAAATPEGQGPNGPQTR